MSVKRYWISPNGIACEDNEGKFVRYEDYAALEARCAALALLEAEPIYQLVNDDWYDTDKDTYDVVVGSGARGRIVYTAPPTPVSVPDEAISRAVDEVMATYACSADECRNLVRKHIEDACRAAMLQGSEPVTTACKSPELTDAQCLEFLAVAFRHARIKGDIEFDDIRLGLKLALEAAPQQEAK